MKFICLKCEAYMAFRKVEAPEQGRLGITFGCDACGAQFSMVTNAGETQLVSSLGVSLGGRGAPPDPLEITRSTLARGTSAMPHGPDDAGSPAGPTPVAEPAAQGAEAKDPLSGCPFSSMVREMGLGSDAAPAAASERAEPSWSEAARAQMDRLPPSVRFVLQGSIGDYARKHGYATITPEVIQAARRGVDALEWSDEASARIENIPDFIRPMARKEIERLARARGSTTVTAEVMDEAKGVFSRLGAH